MSNIKQIVAMLRSRAEGNDEEFYSIALQIAAAEARQGRRTSAETLREAVEAARGARAENSVAVSISRPRGELESLIEHREPRYVLDDVVLGDAVRTRLDDVIRQQQKRTWLREHGKVPSRRILFVGPPGSGKTMTAEAVAGQLKLPLSVIRLEGLITRYMGETAAKLRLVFDETKRRRGVYLFDEFDAVGGRRNATNDVAEMRRVLNSFLQYMEEPSATDSVVLAATNHPDLLDSALLRRFDLVATFELPTKEQAKQIIMVALKPFKVSRMSWSDIEQEADGLSQAELSHAAEDAVKNAILDERDTITAEQLIRHIKERRDMRRAFRPGTKSE
jgi:SpoVK/Ycf46/Vps4 family AAA+-type ATPase